MTPKSILHTDPSINENQVTTGEIIQTKSFDQCNSSSAFNTEVQFSDNDAQTNQQQLVLGASGTAGVELESLAKAQITASIEEHFSKTVEQGQTHTEGASIEVPAHTRQEYTITWEETRDAGTVEYTENGMPKSVNYSYRVGLQLVSASGRDIPCTTKNSTPTVTPSPTPVPAIPVILDIKTTRTLTANGIIIYTFFHFRDADGDSSLITYEVVNSTISGIEVNSDPIKISHDNQIAGAFQAVSWRCLGKGYIVTLNARILDKAGNLSDPVLLTFDCRQQ